MKRLYWECNRIIYVNTKVKCHTNARFLLRQFLNYDWLLQERIAYMIISQSKHPEYLTGTTQRGQRNMAASGEFRGCNNLSRCANETQESSHPVEVLLAEDWTGGLCFTKYQRKEILHSQGRDFILVGQTGRTGRQGGVSHFCRVECNL